MKKYFFLFLIPFFFFNYKSIAQSQQVYLSCSSLSFKNGNENYSNAIQISKTHSLKTALTYSKLTNNNYLAVAAGYENIYSNYLIPRIAGYNDENRFNQQQALLNIGVGKYFNSNRITIKTGGFLSGNLYFQREQLTDINYFSSNTFIGHKTTIYSNSPYSSIGIYHTLDLQFAITKHIFIAAGIQNGIELKLKTYKQTETITTFDASNSITSKYEHVFSESNTELATNFLLFNLSVGYNFLPHPTKPTPPTIKQP